MHELSVAADILDIVRENVVSNGGVKLKSVKVRIGELAGIAPDSLDFCFSAIAKGTELEGVGLKIERTGIVARCTACRIEFKVEKLAFRCPRCGEVDTQVVSGNELQVVEMEVDDEE